jgi:hypothetical protein
VTGDKQTLFLNQSTFLVGSFPTPNFLSLIEVIMVNEQPSKTTEVCEDPITLDPQPVADEQDQQDGVRVAEAITASWSKNSLSQYTPGKRRFQKESTFIALTFHKNLACGFCISSMHSNQV